MKVGILTWKLNNYGTALQAFALVHYVNSVKGVDAKLLNYNLPSKNELVLLKRRNIVRKLLNRLKLIIQKKKNLSVLKENAEDLELKNKKFAFLYTLIPKDDVRVGMDKVEYFEKEYDEIIVGSDQVWNPKYFSEIYFLSFISSAKRNAYSPSLGGGHFLNEKEKRFLKEKVENFNNISCRENTGVELLKELLPNRTIENVLDPTFLLSKEDWLTLFDCKPIIEGKYVLVYCLSANGWYKKAISKIKNEVGAEKVIYVLSEDILYFADKNETLLVNVGPFEFLNLIYNATHIITDSFHGVCFSVNFQKKFSYLERFSRGKSDGENSRILDLMALLEIQGVYYRKGDDYKINDIDYAKIEKNLNNKKVESKEYLNKILKNRK